MLLKRFLVAIFVMTGTAGRNMAGEYVERLSFGGRLKVTKALWEIEYYFAGPDLRHNGDFVRVPGAQIDSYIRAFRASWVMYSEIKASLPADGEFTRKSEFGIQIRVGRFRPGVSLHYLHAMVVTEGDLNHLIAEYEFAKQRAAQIQGALFSI
jgi:hypothetical protein